MDRTPSPKPHPTDAPVGGVLLLPAPSAPDQWLFDVAETERLIAAKVGDVSPDAWRDLCRALRLLSTAERVPPHRRHRFWLAAARVLAAAESRLASDGGRLLDGAVGRPALPPGARTVWASASRLAVAVRSPYTDRHQARTFVEAALAALERELLRPLPAG
ncbi:MAG TPA: hypothetical protein VI452_15755 [Marmoricola sp.]